MASESAVQTRITEYLKQQGATWLKTHGSGVISGEPDLLVAFPPWGFLVCIEVKKPGGVASAQQLIRIKQWQRAGAIAFVAESVEEVRDHIELTIRNKIGAIGDVYNP